MIRHNKHILLIGIDDIDALDWQEKLFLLPFVGINVILLIITNIDARNNLFFSQLAP